MTEERITLPNNSYHNVNILAESDQSRLMFAAYALREAVKAYEAGIKLAHAALQLMEPVEIAQFAHMRLSAFRDLYDQPERFFYTFRDCADDLVLMQERLQKDALIAEGFVEAEPCLAS
jgi:hypothetical protein